MTMEQFCQLSEMEKVSSIMQSGILVAQELDVECRIFVYRLESFYVSASYSVPGDQLSAIECFLKEDKIIPAYRRQLDAVNPAEREYETPEL
jgi:hypothetical protein